MALLEGRPLYRVDVVERWPLKGGGCCREVAIVAGWPL